MSRKPPIGKSLAEVNPDLAKEWHPSKNNELSPSDFTAGSNEKVWWKCPKGPDHEWQASIKSRNNGRGCSICSGKTVVPSVSLSVLNPKLTLEWHPTKNNELTPDDVTPGSSKKVWWKCPKGPDHEWEATIVSRVQGQGCAVCAGKIVVPSTSLAIQRPDLAAEWHPTKNGSLTPFDVMSGTSSKRVWWKCPKGDDHEWEALISSRNQGRGCPICRGLKVVKSNSLFYLNPDLAAEWHPTKNGVLTPHDVSTGSKTMIWWKCDKGPDHEWQATISERSSGHGCSVCRGFTIVDSNSLATLEPELVTQWHPTKNKILPSQVSRYSHKRVWWKCPKGDDHEWEASIDSRVQGNGCPICSGTKVVKSNSLASLYPNLAAQWHPEMNGKLTPNDITAGSSSKMVWWVCDKSPDHIWRSTPNTRTNKNSGCPYCTLTPQSRQELIISFELKLFFNIDPTGFKTYFNNKLWSIDIFIEELDLGIEFDGAYWHKGKRELDKLKTEQIEEQGFKIIRIREEPLKKIFESDIISPKPYDGKYLTNQVLSYILNEYDLDSNKITEIRKYLKKKKLQNEPALDEYIEGVLVEKAKKKAKKQK